MTLAELQPGTKLELELYDSLGEKVKPSLVSEFEWLEGDKTAFIAAPIYEGVIYPVRAGTIMDICFIGDDSLYRFKAKVLNRGLRDNVAMLKIEIEGGMHKVQRRQFYRFECSLPVRYRLVGTLNPVYNDDTPFTKAVTKNLSGGGLSIAINEKIERDKYIECELMLADDKVVRFYGKVVRLIKLDNDLHKYEAGVVFRKIENKDREDIIKYIFQQQRNLRKKGLI